MPIGVKCRGLRFPRCASINFAGEQPVHFPRVQAKLAYDAAALYVIFQVADRYVRATAENYQDQVCEDSCVEFFFTPGEDISHGYFNLEVNCGGTVLFHHQKGRKLMMCRYPEQTLNNDNCTHAAKDRRTRDR